MLSGGCTITSILSTRPLSTKGLAAFSAVALSLSDKALTKDANRQKQTAIINVRCFISIPPNIIQDTRRNEKGLGPIAKNSGNVNDLTLVSSACEGQYEKCEGCEG
jgi:hypothetical protein